VNLSAISVICLSFLIHRLTGPERLPHGSLLRCNSFNDAVSIADTTALNEKKV
jgi:hypothetical protein